jgi:predicted MFS family arabinose efflux permease
MAAFYATAAIACQEYAISAAGERNSARAIGAFLAVINGGLFAGSALGGLLAGRFGFTAAFLVGAALALLSLIMGMASMRGRAGDRVGARAANEPERQNPLAWLNVRYLALLVGVSVPMNATMVIFIWYLTPLMLDGMGSGPAEIARVLMLYNLANLLLGPIAARLAGGRFSPEILVVIGVIGIASSLLSIGLWGGFWAIAVAVAGVGASQILVEVPLYTLAFRITGGPGPGIDALRVLERIGSIAGLAASAVLLGVIGAEASIRLLGFTVLFGISVYAIVETAGRFRRV